MKTLILKSLIICSIALSILCVIWKCPGVYTYELSAIINKMDILNTKQSPRIILIGGSNLLSLDSRLIEKELPYSVVNLALWFGINYRILIEEIMPHLKPHDIILFIIEYTAFFDNSSQEKLNADSQKAFFMISPENQIKRYLRECEIIDGFTVFTELVQLKSKAFVQNLKAGYWYRLRENGLQDFSKFYNENGDLRIPWPRKRPLDSALYSSLNLEQFGFLHAFVIHAEEKKVNVFLSFPPYPKEEYEKNKKQIKGLYRGIVSSLKIPLLNRPDECTLPSQFFTDNVFHIDPAGEAIRTRNIIQGLKMKTFSSK